MQNTALKNASDESLVERTLWGEVQAFGVLVNRYRGAVTLIAHEVLHSWTLAEDTAQEVFLVAYHSLSRLREPERFASWLYAITRHQARKAYRKLPPQTTLDTPEIEAVTRTQYRYSNHSPEHQALQVERSQNLWKAIHRLKPEWRVVFLLRYEQEWSASQIAAFLAIPTTTVNWRLHEARKYLKQQLTLQEQES